MLFNTLSYQSVSARQSHNILFSQAHLLHKNTSKVIHSCNTKQPWTNMSTIRPEYEKKEEPPHGTLQYSKTSLPFNRIF
jgi:hypothetical protein